jgi:DNA-directed RNA polymerase specialized sigma subunit
VKNKIRDKYFICFAILFIVFELRGYTQNIGSVRLTTTKSIENLAKHEIISEDVIFTVVPRGLVISVAMRYLDKGLSDEELVEVGKKGLIIAIRQYDRSSRFKFIPYAVWLVRRGILQAIEDKFKS